MLHFRRTLTALAATSMLAAGSSAVAEEVTISVWANQGATENYRIDAIKIAADLLEREYEARGETLKINVEGKVFTSWSEFKQAVTLAGEAGTAPNIVVSSHGDIAPWAQAGIIVPAEDYVDLDAWPLNDIYPNLLEIATYEGQVWGIPQDAESRPFFFWNDYMKAIGYTDEDLAELADRVRAGEYTLQNVLEDAKKMQDAGLVEPGKGFWPRPTKGGDFWQFYMSYGGEFATDDGRLLFDREAMKGAYQFFVDAVNLGVTRKNHLGTPWDQWHGALTSGQVGIWHGGTWQYSEWTKKYGLDFFKNVTFTLIPSGGNERGRANTLTHPLVYLITKQDSEKEMSIAGELITIASEPRINALHAIKSAHLGITRSEEKVSLYANDRWTREATEVLLPYATAAPNNPNFGQYFEVMMNGLQAAWTGQKTVEQAVADAEKELKAALGDEIVFR